MKPGTVLGSNHFASFLEAVRYYTPMKPGTVLGSNHFASFLEAVRYYTPYHYPDTREVVAQKVKVGEIVCGCPPTLQPGDDCFIDSDGRYQIVCGR